MRRSVYWQQIHVGMPQGVGLAEPRLGQALAGYILEQPPSPPPGLVRVWGHVIVVTSQLSESETPFQPAPSSLPRRRPPELETGLAKAAPPSSSGLSPRRLILRPVGRLTPVTELQREDAVQPLSPVVSPPTSSPPVLQPVRSGQSYRITSPPEQGLVRPALAEALQTVFDRFACESGFSPDKPLDIQLSRGFKAGSHGHGEGRAADIAAVAGKSLLTWKKEWAQAIAAIRKLSTPQQQAEAMTAEQKRNLGYGLYKALQAHGGWRVNPKGWRVYRNVMQLFGPWTAMEGPWQQMQIENPNAYQQERLADQQWVFQAHQDHIHVAR